MYKDLDSSLIWESYQDFLIEGRKDRYLQMFQFVPNDNTSAWDYINKEMAWALKILKTEDKIIWYLNQVKYLIFTNTAKNAVDNPKTMKTGQKLGNKLGYRFPFEVPNIRERFHNQMEHYLTQGVDVLDNYRITDLKKTPDLVMQELATIEKEYFERVKDSIKMADSDEIVIEFDDGSVWVNTHTPTCTSEESKIMQHCGNQYGHKASGDEIFSFRTPSNVKGRWNPHLTFVVNDGIIRESKGKQNEKPDVDKYGKYIFELLKSDYITGFSQYDTHAAQNNFYLDDLPDTWVEELRKIKDESFFEGGEKEDIDKKAKELFEQYTFENVDVDYDVDDYSDDEATIYGYVGATIKIPLKETDIFQSEYWDDTPITDNIDFTFRIAEEGLNYEYDEQTRILEINVNANSYDQDYYGNAMERFESFLDDCQTADRRLPDADDLYEELMKMSVILPVFGQIFSDIIDENTTKYITDLDENFPELEFFDIEYDSSEAQTANFDGEIELGKLPVEIIQTDSTLRNLGAYNRLGVTNVPNDHPLRQLHSIFPKSGGNVHAFIKLYNQLLTLVITTEMEYDSSEDTLEYYKSEYLTIRKYDAYFINYHDKIIDFFKQIIIPMFESKIKLTADNIQIEEKDEGNGKTLIAKYRDRNLFSDWVSSRDIQYLEGRKERLKQEVLKKMPFIYAGTYEKDLFKKFLEDPNYKPSYDDPRQQQFKFEKKIIRFKKIFYG